MKSSTTKIQQYKGLSVQAAGPQVTFLSVLKCRLCSLLATLIENSVRFGEELSKLSLLSSLSAALVVVRVLGFPLIHLGQGIDPSVHFPEIWKGPLHVVSWNAINDSA